MPDVSYSLATGDCSIGEQIKYNQVDQNSQDCYAVAVVNTTAVSTETVGHAP